MAGLNDAAAWLLRRSALLLPAERRDWGEAAWSEAADMPAGWARLSWLVGGMWLVVKEGRVFRRLSWWSAVIAGAAGVVRLGWHSGSANPAAPIDRIRMIAIVITLIILPWVTRRHFGPVGAGRAMRLVRAGGYAAVCALVPILVLLSRFADTRHDHFHAFNQANWESDMVATTIVLSVVHFALIAAYATAVLAMTARRSSVAARTVAIGGGSGVATGLVVYGLTPLGSTMHLTNPWLVDGYDAMLVLLVIGVPLLAAALAAWHTSGRDRVRQGVAAGVWAGGAGALVIGILTISTMLLLPRQVKLEWNNPDPNVPHGTSEEVQMSVGDAAGKYEFFLLLGPLLGVAAGHAGATIALRRRPQHEEMHELVPVI